MNLLPKYATTFVWVVILSLTNSTSGSPPGGDMKPSWDEAPMHHPQAKYRVVMVRHGESHANEKRTVLGWIDTDLTKEGEEQARQAGRALKTSGYKFDVAYSSLLTVAARTRDIILDEMGLSNVVKDETWRLNVRHSGALTGRSVKEVYDEYKKPKMDEMMHTYENGPPPLSKENPIYATIAQDPRYPVPPPATESLKDALERTIPYWKEVIEEDLKAGKRVLIVSHSTTLRGLAYYLEGKVDKDVLRWKLPLAKPFIYEFNENMEVLTARQFVTVDGEKAPGSASVATSSQE